MEDVKYIRVSTPEQNTARQKDDLKSYIDICSGSIPFRDRPQGEKLIKHAHLGYINSVQVHSIDRLGRNTIDILNTIQLLTKLQVNVISQKEGLHTLLENGVENPTAKLMVGILGTLAEFELTRIKERQAEGIAKAKARGVYKTNGGNRTKETKTKFLSKKKNALCLKELKRGNSVRRSAKIAGVSLMTAQKVKNYILEG
jgi:DNA invertase Pin-like site-specific DNA recombinase|tara:strand:+ start:177 stop:776 length:600 start_codon:yes stop_codon:yes gene_type:complete